MTEQVYLDHAATTPVDARVLEAMLPFFNTSFGNPASVHRYGQRAEAAVEEARERVAACLRCRPEEIVFTSGGSESDNLALRGAAQAKFEQSGRVLILTSRAEHPAVSKTAVQMCTREGFRLEWLQVDKYGMVNPQAVEEAIGDQPAIVSVMYANNEIGTINPVHEIAEVCHRHHILFHTDAIQAATCLPVETDALGADLVSFTGHKLYGPKGVGALYVRRGTQLLPQVTGGGQELGLRAGTTNVPAIVGFAKALQLAVEEREARLAHLKLLQGRLIHIVLEKIPDAQLTGHPEARLPGHASFAFKDVDGNLLLQMLDSAGFACSSGSACKTGSPEPSEVMAAIGLPRAWGLGSLRVTLGSGTTETHIEAFLSLLPELVEQVRSLCRG